MASGSKKTASSHTTEVVTGAHSFKIVGYTLNNGCWEIHSVGHLHDRQLRLGHLLLSGRGQRGYQRVCGRLSVAGEEER
ncbi:hypothetical protein HU200_039952 [Digitaria exilis]|uniref:Uncharacterized protein n=1 Tax=Digitaria exilis TaxID=1010633 RepID=A0A835EHY3_9POAL|nr:hypothetical protein HU200_039952 [Digitaria exilis]